MPPAVRERPPAHGRLDLRVKDVDFGSGEIRVRRAKRARDRVTVLPGSLTAELQRHLDRVQRVHRRDLAGGAGKVRAEVARRGV